MDIGRERYLRKSKWCDDMHACFLIASALMRYYTGLQGQGSCSFWDPHDPARLDRVIHGTHGLSLANTITSLLHTHPLIGLRL
jgi:hypothetical protein